MSKVPVQRNLALASCLAFSLLLMNGCRRNNQDIPFIQTPLSQESSALATSWADISLSTLKGSQFKSPTYASRCLGYLGLAMYESIVNGDSTSISLAGQLQGLNTLPMPEQGKTYYWPLVLNAAEDTLLRLLVPFPADMLPQTYQDLNSFASKTKKEKSSGVPSYVIARSEAYGLTIAFAIFNWAKTDGGDEGYAHNFDPSFVFPNGPSYWVPPVSGQSSSPWPLHPHWVNNRCFIPANATIPIPPITPYSQDTASDYFKMYNDVYVKNKILTSDEIDIAAWWSDDPSESFSPPGHSYNLATIAVKTAKSNLMTATEAYARTGMAVTDAFINCWKAKYTYFNERPSTYVNANIDSFWIQYWPEPPFPAFPSGHSTQSAATAVALAGLYGDQFAFIDNTNQNQTRTRPVIRELLFTRSFKNFWESALECGYSRILGGIHTRQDNETGLALGSLVGQHLNGLHWRK